ncbi:MAG TPA: hypothetical protein VIL00_11235 [Pseudonocardiaceae bacterium]
MLADAAELVEAVDGMVGVVVSVGLPAPVVEEGFGFDPVFIGGFATLTTSDMTPTSSDRTLATYENLSTHCQRTLLRLCREDGSLLSLAVRRHLMARATKVRTVKAAAEITTVGFSSTSKIVWRMIAAEGSSWEKWFTITRKGYLVR